MVIVFNPLRAPIIHGPRTFLPRNYDTIEESEVEAFRMTPLIFETDPGFVFPWTLFNVDAPPSLLATPLQTP